jgi:hypothetical protein
MDKLGYKLPRPSSEIWRRDPEQISHAERTIAAPNVDFSPLVHNKAPIGLLQAEEEVVQPGAVDLCPVLCVAHIRQRHHCCVCRC